MTIRNKIIFGFILILIGICFSISWVYYPGTIFALVSLLTGMCILVTGALLLDIARNERFKKIHGEELWHPSASWKLFVVYILVRFIIALVIFVIVTYFMFK